MKQKNGWLAAVVVIFILLAAGLAVNGAVESFLYPTKYTDEVFSSADEYAVERGAVFAVIKCESRFKQDALSHKGAIGLMQIMPSTGAYLYGKVYDGEQFADRMLYTPKINIRLGTYYLRYLTDRFQDIYWAAAAYNAGEGTVAQWIGEGLSLEDIPYPETREYIARFKAALKKYRKILTRRKQTGGSWNYARLREIFPPFILRYTAARTRFILD
ncbi:MAG: lytic transglycosylase domain-containing protein [Clostridiales bacterium]|jgi:soluble lytic murein transglycosylase|nr:lytic transglycosylase domain-containing protein [Clostridiales bacterium]